MERSIVKVWEEHSVGEAIILTLCVVVGSLLGVFGEMCLRA